MEKHTRRSFLRKGALATAVIGTAAGCAAPDVQRVENAGVSGWLDQQAPGFYRLRLGDFRITVLSDGTAPRDLPKIMSKPAEVAEILEASHEVLPIELSINCFLVDTGVQKVLVDTGAGELFGATSGSLVENLRHAGYRPEDVDMVLLTHFHGDHSGGLSIGGRVVFPNAVVYVDKKDPDYWFDATAEADAPADRKLTFSQTRQTVDPYVKSGQLQIFNGEAELLPGIRTVPEPGHTPGLTGYMLESRGDRLLLWGDIVHAAEVQFRDPSVAVEYDVNPAEAVASRLQVLSDAAKQGYLVGGAHLSFPGLGHVRAEQSGFSWVPAPYISHP